MKDTTPEMIQSEYVNKFYVCGNIVNKYSSPNALILIVGTTNPTTQRRDYPRMIITDSELMKQANAELEIGDRVSVSGDIRSSKKYPSGVVVITQYTKELSRLEAAFSGIEVKPDANIVLLRGKISREHYSPSPDVTITTLEMYDEEGYINYPRFTCFGNKAKRIRDKGVGEFVDALCYIKSRNRKEGVKVSRQSIVLQHMK